MVCYYSLLPLGEYLLTFIAHSLNQGRSLFPSSIPPPSSNSPPTPNASNLYTQVPAGTQADAMQNRVSISPDCVSKFNELKLNKKIKYILYKLDDGYKEIVVEEASEDGDWEHFREKLINAKSKNKAVRCP
jgi:hypothetical protein